MSRQRSAAAARACLLAVDDDNDLSSVSSDDDLSFHSDASLEDKAADYLAATAEGRVSLRRNAVVLQTARLEAPVTVTDLRRRRRDRRSTQDVAMPQAADDADARAPERKEAKDLDTRGRPARGKGSHLERERQPAPAPLKPTGERVGRSTAAPKLPAPREQARLRVR